MLRDRGREVGVRGRGAAGGVFRLCSAPVFVKAMFVRPSINQLFDVHFNGIARTGGRTGGDLHLASCSVLSSPVLNLCSIRPLPSSSLLLHPPLLLLSISVILHPPVLLLLALIHILRRHHHLLLLVGLVFVCGGSRHAFLALRNATDGRVGPTRAELSPGVACSSIVLSSSVSVFVCWRLRKAMCV